jgi:hypothetical protein
MISILFITKTSLKIAFYNKIKKLPHMKYHQIPKCIYKKTEPFMAQMKPNSVAVFNSNDIYPVSADSTLPFAQHRDIFT